MGYGDEEQLLPTSRDNHALQNNNDKQRGGYDSIRTSSLTTTTKPSTEDGQDAGLGAALLQGLRSIPAVLVLAAWNIMLSVPFGSMFFSDAVPLPAEAKERMGLRMSLMALGVGQTVMGGWLTGFEALTLWELAEVAPFYQDFAGIAATSCGGDSSKIYPTTVYLISLSTLGVGVGFFVCGYFRIGRLLSFFPSYVTLGVVGGIGVWAVTMAAKISASSFVFGDDDNEGSEAIHLWDRAATPQFALAVVLALGIRPLRKLFPDFVLLDPVYYLSIPVFFHIVLAVSGIGFDEAVAAGYMFRAPAAETDLVNEVQPSLWHEAGELWTLFDPSKVEWGAAWSVAPQIFAGAILSILITAPFIPPIATLPGNETFDPDREFVAHGIANLVSGLVLPGGVPICQCYSSTVLYRNSGGGGKISNALLSMSCFVAVVYGPVVAGYLPRCMASAILLDMGVALFLEGVANESAHTCDPVEYASIWVILTVMTVFDMTSGLMAGLFMALFTSTYASSSDDPVRRVCDADTFPSSQRRRASETTVLDNPRTGRKKIAIVQLQGSVFFGNLSKIQERLLDYLENQMANESIVIFDCTLVASLDSSACIFFDKIQTTLREDHGVVATVFVASPPKLELEKAPPRRKASLDSVYRDKHHNHKRTSHLLHEINPAMAFSIRGSERTTLGAPRRRSSTTSLTTRGGFDRALLLHQDIEIHGTCFDTLDQALASCEDQLLHLARVVPSSKTHPIVPKTILAPVSDLSEDDDSESSDRALALQMLKAYCHTEDSELLNVIVKAMRREILPKGTMIWNLGDKGLPAKLFLRGSVFAYVMDDGDEYRFRANKPIGSFLGLRSLLLEERHLASARCDEDCTFFCLDREAYDTMVKESPKAARALELGLSRYLSHRLQHVSNRIYQARSLPI